jgi:hypothetical protein
MRSASGSRLQVPEPGVGAALQSRLKTTDANQPVAMAIIAVVRP